MKFTAIKNFPYVRDREARSIEEADKVWRSRWVFFRRRASCNPSCVSIAISEYRGLASRYTTRSKKPIRLQAWLFKYDYIAGSGSRFRECQERPRKTDPPRTPHHVSDPRSDPSLTRVAVKRRANSISQARRARPSEPPSKVS
jgi:hypothetical protein